MDRKLGRPQTILNMVAKKKILTPAMNQILAVQFLAKPRTLLSKPNSYEILTLYLYLSDSRTQRLTLLISKPDTKMDTSVLSLHVINMPNG
jgi:hypothetical protein